MLISDVAKVFFNNRLYINILLKTFRIRDTSIFDFVIRVNRLNNSMVL
jgi:hypothetical protein